MVKACEGVDNFPLANSLVPHEYSNMYCGEFILGY